ncbi:MAG: hypothetical protein ACLFNQ_08580 [Spirochaetaceae bacterium]
MTRDTASRSANALVRATVLLCIVLSVLGCAATAGVAPGQVEAALPSDATASVTFRPERLGPSFERLIASFGVYTDEISDVLQRSERIIAAIGVDGEPNAFFAVAEGSYPAGWVRMGLSLSRSWRRENAPSAGRYARYYQERNGPSQIAVPSSRVLVFSNGRVAQMLQGLGAFSSGPDVLTLDPTAELGVRLPRITPELRSRLPREVRSLPFETVELLIHGREDDPDAYTISGDVGFTTEQAAQVFNVVGRLVIATLAEGVDRRDISVERTERRIRFDGMRVTDDTLAGWIDGFSDALGGTETEL